MATKNFRSTVLEPTSEFAKGDKLRFTALATVGEVLKGSFSETTIGEDGVYSVDLQYGKHRIDYKPYEGVWRHFADVEVNADTLATTLQDLALASVPVTDETVLVLQGILADAEAAKAESAAIRDDAAASAAAAAEDAAKLADVTPDSIGAVSNLSGNIVLKPTAFYTVESGTPADRFIKVKIPQGMDGRFMSLHIKLSSRDQSCPSDIFISSYMSPADGIFYGSKINAIGGYGNLSVRFCTASEVPSDRYLIIEKTFFSVRFEMFCVMSQRISSTDLISTGWEITEDSVVTESHVRDTVVIECDPQSTTAMSSVVRSITYDNNTYQNIDAFTAKNLSIPSAAFDAALADQQASSLFLSEKNIALQIFADFNLGTGEQEITGSDISDVRAYIQSIDPAKGLKAGHLQRAKIPRPSIFDRYS